MDTSKIAQRLEKLREHTLAQFGIMTPQHMVEHLTLTVKISYNRIKIPEFVPNEKQLAQKRILLDTPAQFPLGVVAPGTTAGDLLPLKYTSLSEAKEQLLASLNAYNGYFHSTPDATSVHPRFGSLNHAEWERFHRKHFEHHLEQFGL